MGLYSSGGGGFESFESSLSSSIGAYEARSLPHHQAAVAAASAAVVAAVAAALVAAVIRQ